MLDVSRIRQTYISILLLPLALLAALAWRR
jgi:hypothetical protein